MQVGLDMLVVESFNALRANIDQSSHCREGLAGAALDDPFGLSLCVAFAVLDKAN